MMMRMTRQRHRERGRLYLIITISFVCIVIKYMKIKNSSEKMMQKDDPRQSTNNNLITYCLWFVPPEPYFSQISIQIETLSKINDSPVFSPHITIVGKITIPEGSETTILEELKTTFQNHFGKGGVPCVFNQDRGFVTSYDAKNEIVWSQAYAAVVERDEKLLKAIEITKKCLFESKHVVGNKERLQPTSGFPYPLKEPHMSFIYKKSAIQVVDDMELPEDFIASKIVLVKTDPCTFEHIPNWKVVGSIVI